MTSIFQNYVVLMFSLLPLLFKFGIILFLPSKISNFRSIKRRHFESRSHLMDSGHHILAHGEEVLNPNDIYVREMNPNLKL